jgi:hypothetical protein
LPPEPPGKRAEKHAPPTAGVADLSAVVQKPTVLGRAIGSRGNVENDDLHALLGADAAMPCLRRGTALLQRGLRS